MRLIPIVASVASLCVAGCSILVSTAERTQCRTDADCGGTRALEGRVCSLGFCVLKTNKPVTVSTDAGSACVSTKLCTQANSGRASVCKKAGAGPCVPWQTPECPSIGGNWQDPNAIVVGSLLPLHVLQGDSSRLEGAYAKRLLRAIDLGLEELTGVVPAGLVVPGGQPPRPVAVLHCDTNGNAETTKRLYDHLTEVVGTQAIIVGWDEDLVAVAEPAMTRKTAVVCSDCLAPFPGLEGLPTGWKILPSITHDAPLVAWRVADLERRIKALTPGDTRVAVITEPYRVQRTFSDALVPLLKFNGGKTIAQNGANYLAVETPDPRVVQAIAFAPIAQSIIDHTPNIVVVGMSSDFPTHLLTLIETGWPAGKPRPHYVLTQLAYEATPYAGVVSTDELRARISGTRPAATPALQANIDAFDIKFSKTYGEPADGTYSGYEAFYAMAYALTAASFQPLLDGSHISSGFERLSSGTTIDVGSSMLPTGLSLLGQRGTINLRGLGTELDWDPKTHEISSDMEMFCFGKDAKTGALTVERASDVRYATSTKLVTGSYACN